MWIKRIGIYLLGIMSVSTGIVLCALCGLGISPVSSWPYVLAEATSLSFGTLTMVFHLFNITFQYIVERKLINVKVLLQIPVAVVFGILLDKIKKIIVVDTSNPFSQGIALLLSVIFTAFGMALMINMELVQNPPDGCVKDLSEMTRIDMGKMKLIYDFFMALTSSLVGYLLLGDFRGLGIATVVSAIFVGKILTGLQKSLGVKLKSLI